MPIALLFGFLIIVGLSGGVNGGAGFAGDTDSETEPTPVVAGTSDSQEDVTKTDTATYRNTGFFTRSYYTAPVEAAVYSRARVETLPALNIEDRSTEFRGFVDMGSQKEGVVFLVYGYDLNSVRKLTNNRTQFEEIPETLTDKARAVSLSKRPRGEKEYTRRVSGLIPDVTYYYKICLEHEIVSGTKVISCGNVKNLETNSRYNESSRYYIPRATMYRPTNITANSATISGKVQMNDAKDGIAFFVYGEDKEQIEDVENLKRYTDVDEDDENLQRVRVGAFVLGEAEYERVIDELEGDTEHYYRLCVEYDGERSGMVCTGVRSFETTDDDRSIAPYAETGAATVGPSWVKISSLIQANSYRDNVAFLVVGTDRDKVVKAENASSFARLRQYDYELQKVLLDDDLDFNKTFTKTIDFLEKGAYYYRACVEYETENSYGREEERIRCGEVRSFYQI